jgi:predicted phage tail protein
MKNSIYLVLLFISFTALSQQRMLEITNIKTGKIKVFEENQRIKLRTLDKKKWVGNLKFSDSLSFTVNNHKIRIDSLQSIKNQPKVLGTIKTVLLISGAAILGASIVAASGGSDSAFLLFAIGAGTTISSGIAGSVNSSYTHRKWKYKIVDSSLNGEVAKQK